MSELSGANFMRMLADRIKKKIPKGFGFMIMVFPFNEPGIANYISNARHEDMIKALEEKAKVLRAKGDFPTFEEN